MRFNSLHLRPALRIGLALALCGAAQRASAARGELARPAAPATSAAWLQAARRDVDAAYRLLAENHPGMFNREDPGFASRLAASRAKGLALAAQVRDRAGFAAALDGFSAGLRDGHALAFADTGGPADLNWPGFVAAWRGDRLLVSASSLSAIPVGATIQGCDGRDTRALVLQNVFAFSGRPDEAGQWWVQAPRVFQDDGNPFVKPPQRCRVSMDGRESEVDLSWRPVDAHFRAWKAARNGEPLRPGLTEPRPGLFWLAMPTFQPDEAERMAYRSAMDALLSRRAAILTADAVVIDLRGNQGGSSFWSEEAAKALWGAASVQSFEGADPSRVWWRASQGNTDYVVHLAETLRTQGQAESAAIVDRAAAGMRAALARAEPYYVEPTETAGPTSGGAVVPLRAPVYVIVPGQCASACLDALDVFAHFPNTKLIGAPSSADSVYLEVRIQALPDGLAKVVVPNKLYRNRPRASGYVYPPAIEVRELSWSTAAFRGVVEADLKRTKAKPT